MNDKVVFDKKTRKWFDKQPAWEVTTCRRCPKCGLAYKPSLGHICEKGGNSDDK